MKHLLVLLGFALGVLVTLVLMFSLFPKNTPHDGEHVMVKYGFTYHPAVVHDDNEGVIFQLDDGIVGDLSGQDWYPVCQTP